MKLSVEADCSPAELREFLGMPEIKPMQDAWLEDMNKKMEVEIKKMSPAALMEKWMNSASVNPEWLRSMFGGVIDVTEPTKK
ncbi:DUF6489 family protein [Leisingera sp. NJS204]|uniref:DUF6489 family protein n=1 Tax=Leisingera sp. NJS204 TaxID=2508307 RepID=UPI0010101AEF|nr:DUF6489 family protein [Leisingera sp. NJS204]QAX30751.1 hypothetical protein ETW24_16030 [Leisingera sp. NJS204]